MGASHDLPARVLRRLRALERRTRYRLGIRPPRPRNVTAAGGFRHPIREVISAISPDAYRTLFPESCAAEIEQAYRLASHDITLLGHRTQHGERIAWSRDPVSGRDWPRAFSPDIAYRGAARHGDIKLPWELNKHQYFFTLGKAAWLTGDRSLAEEIVRQIDHWIDENPPNTGINWISALEVGARVISWILAYPFYEPAATPGFRDRVRTSMAEQLSFVAQHLSTGPFANTHLAGEAASLVIGGLFLACDDSAAWVARGQQILEEEIDRQVTRDGVHAERSVAYHRFFLDQYYLTASFLSASGRGFSPATMRTLEAMTAFLMDALFADGTAPAFGDSDDARTVWFRWDCPRDYRGLLAAGAVLFRRGDFKAQAGALSEDLPWLFGADGIDAYNRLEAREPAGCSASYPDAGYYVMRGGWDATAPVLIADCGSLGFGPAGHGHSDALSVQLFANGFPVLVDPGTFSYNLDYEWRDAFRGSRAHNTIVIDGVDQSIPGDRMSWKSMATATARRWVTTPWFDLLDGEHDGYARLSDPVSHRRTVLFLRPDIWVIWDEVCAEHDHRLELLLHLSPECTVERDASGSLRVAAPEKPHVTIRVGGLDGLALPVAIVEGDDRERAGWFSPEYGVRKPGRMLRVEQAFAGVCGLVTCVSSSNAAPVITATAGAIAVRVNRDGGEDVLQYRTDVASDDDRALRFERNGVQHIVNGRASAIDAKSGRVLA